MKRKTKTLETLASLPREGDISVYCGKVISARDSKFFVRVTEILGKKTHLLQLSPEESSKCDKPLQKDDEILLSLTFSEGKDVGIELRRHNSIDRRAIITNQRKVRGMGPK